MSYWFAEPHTLVLAGAQIDLRNPRECPRLGEYRSLVAQFLAVRTETLLRLQTLISGQADQNSRRARCRATEASFAGSAAMPLPGRVEASDQG
jgi:hypothetical protein